MLPNPQKVFISSTGYDLTDYRRAAIDVCNELGLVPVAMEFFEAMGVGATAGSRSKLDGAGVYVGIVAWRYGYVEPGLTTSVTEAEFDYAGKKEIERLCFVLDPTHPWPIGAVDAQRDAIDAFRAKIGRLIRAQFTTVESFKYELRAALEGWLTRIAARSSRGESDEERIRLMRKVFDRPAFRVTFMDELQEDLAEAIDNVQTTLNTGKLFTRKGVSLGDIPDRRGCQKFRV